MGAVKLKLSSIDFLERDVKLRMPFRFGVVTLTESPQAFVRCRIRTDDGREAEAHHPGVHRFCVRHPRACGVRRKGGGGPG